MATVQVDDELFRRLRTQAEQQGLTVEDGVQRILSEHAIEDGPGRKRRAALLNLIARSWERPLYLDGRVSNGLETLHQMREEDEIDLMRVVRGER